MYEMLVGHPPFYAQTPQETQFKVMYSCRALIHLSEATCQTLVIAPDRILFSAKKY